MNGITFSCGLQENNRDDPRDNRYRHGKELSNKIAYQQGGEYKPGRLEHLQVFNRIGRLLQLVDVIRFWNALSEIQIQHQNTGQQAENVGHDHSAGICGKADAEKVCRNDVHQVTDHKRKRRRIGDKSAGHDKWQDHLVLKFQVTYHGKYNRC